MQGTSDEAAKRREHRVPGASGGVDSAAGTIRAREVRNWVPLGIRQGLSGPIVFAWGFVFVLAAIDWSWNEQAGIVFTGWASVFASIAALLATGLFYGLSGRSDRLANVGHYAGLWVAFSLTGAILTYLAASVGLPLHDAELHRLDGTLGFNWAGAFLFVNSHAAVKDVLGIAYLSFLPQVVLSIMYFAHVRRNDRNAELLLSAMVALAITAAISAVIPAEGPYSFLTGKPLLFVRDLLIVRSTAQPAFQLSNLQGIITFPSYHTVLAILLVYSHRPPLKSFFVVAGINLIMLLAIPVEGSHYLVDVIAGAAVAAFSIAAVRVVQTRFARGCGSAAALDGAISASQ
jgi:PAP2 superfamily